MLAIATYVGEPVVNGNNYTITIIGTWSPWKPTLLIWYDFWWVKKWVKSRCKISKAWTDEKEKWERMKMKMVPKSKGIALGTRSQNYMAKVPTWFNTITLTKSPWSVSCYAYGSHIWLIFIKENASHFH